MVDTTPSSDGAGEEGADPRRWWERLFDRLLERLDGDDVFVSYSRRDGQRYALGLTTRLEERKFATRIDARATQPSEHLPPPLVRALHRSRVLVVIGTRCSYESKAVAAEVREFLGARTGRTLAGMVVPVDLHGGIEQAVWWPDILGVPVWKQAAEDDGEEEEDGRGEGGVSERSSVITRRDTVSDAPEGDPSLVSDEIADHVEGSFVYLSKAARLRLATRLASGLLALLAVGIGVATWITSSKIDEADEASRRADDADRRRGQAEQAATDASRRADDAEARRGEAEQAAANALAAAREANARAATVEERSRRLAAINLGDEARIALDAGNVQEAQALLDLVDDDLRHWEWEHLAERLDPTFGPFGDGEPATRVARGEGGHVAIAGPGRITFFDPVFQVTPYIDGTPSRVVEVDGTPRALAVSPDGERIAWGMDDSSLVRLLDPSAPDAEPELLWGHWGESVDALAFSPDGRYLASGTTGATSAFDDDDPDVPTVTGDTVRLWDAVTGEAIANFMSRAGLRAGVHCLAFDESSERLAAGRFDGTVAIWDVARRKLVRTLGGGGERVTALEFSRRTPGLLVLGRTEGTLEVWDSARRGGARLWSAQAHGSYVASVGFAHTGPPGPGPMLVGPEILVSVSWDGSAAVTWMQKGIVRRLRSIHAERLDGAVLLDEDVFLTVSRDAGARLWPTNRATEEARPARARDVAVSPDGTRFVMCSLLDYVPRAGDDSYRRLVVKLDWKHRVHDHDADISVVRFAPGGALAFGDEAGVVTLWDLDADEDDERRPVIDTQGRAVTILEFVDDETIVAGDEAGAVHVWRAATGQETHPAVLPDAVSHLSVGPRTGLVAVAGTGAVVRGLWLDRAEGPFELITDGSPVSCVSVSAGEHLVGCGRTDGTIDIVPVEPRARRTLDTDEAAVNQILWWEGLEMSPEDGFTDTHFAVGHVDGLITIWTVPGGNEVERRRGDSTVWLRYDEGPRKRTASAEPARPLDVWPPLETPSRARRSPTVQVWDLSGLVPWSEGLSEDVEGTACAWHPTYGVFAVADRSGGLGIWTPELDGFPSPEQLSGWAAHPVDAEERFDLPDFGLDPPIGHITFAASGELASAGRDGVAKLWRPPEPWDRSAPFELALTRDHPGAVRAVAFDGTGAIFASAGAGEDEDERESDDQQSDAAVTEAEDTEPSGIVMWSRWADPSAQTRELAITGGRVDALAFGPKGAVLAAGLSSGEVVLVDLATATERERLPRSNRGGVADLHFDPDGSRLFVNEWTGGVSVWDLGLGTRSLRLELPLTAVTTTDMTPGGLLVAGLADGSVRLWRGRFSGK